MRRLSLFNKRFNRVQTPFDDTFKRQALQMPRVSIQGKTEIQRQKPHKKRVKGGFDECHGLTWYGLTWMFRR